jgi:hypothetical protein
MKNHKDNKLLTSDFIPETGTNIKLFGFPKTLTITFTAKIPLLQ